MQELPEMPRYERQTGGLSLAQGTFLVKTLIVFSIVVTASLPFLIRYIK